MAKLNFQHHYSSLHSNMLIWCSGNIFIISKIRVVSKKTFADNLLTPMSSKMSTSFFLQSKRN